MKLKKLVVSVFIVASIFCVSFYAEEYLRLADAKEVVSLPASTDKKTNEIIGVAASNEKEIDYFPLQNSINQERVAQEVNERHKNDVLGMGREDSDYANYADGTLAEMADAGDIVAMKMLALRYQKQIKNIGDAEYPAFRAKLETLYHKAIIYGDREFLGFMPGLTEASRRISDPRLTPTQKHDAALDLLAHMEFMGLRGALKQKYTEQIMAFEIYPEFGFPKTITEADKQLVRKKAQEIYEQYEKQRLELGLGPFDNSVPEELSKVYEYERRVYEEKMGDNAI